MNADNNTGVGLICVHPRSSAVPFWIQVMWDAQQYQKFARERARPFTDLLARVPHEQAGFIADLGCGPGVLTRALAQRWPTAHVVGVDSSPAMLQQARLLAVAGRVEFVEADLASWAPPRPVDLLVSN